MKNISTVVSVVCGLLVIGAFFFDLKPGDLLKTVHAPEHGTAVPTVQALPAPTPTPIVITINQPAPVVFTQQGQQPAQIAINQPPAPATAVPEAPVQVEARPAMIVVHERPEGAVVTGSGACAVGGNVARRCGK